MKKNLLLIFALSFAVSTYAAKNDSAETNLSPEQVEAKYTAAIEGRTAAILKALNLSDTNKIEKVRDAIIAQYRALNAWHDANDAKLKAARRDTNAIAQIQSSLKKLHDDFLAQLSENLSPEQIEIVKDKMTYGKVQFTFAGYLAQYPNLSNENKNEILKLLKQAREEAMDGGSAKEKAEIFQRYKGKINNYLSKQGVHPQKRKTTATDSEPEK